MANLNLPNVREGGDIRFRIGLEDNGVAVDWSGLEGIRVFLYADAQKQVSGECTIEVDAEDNTVLACLYSGDDPQFRGINSVLVRAKYQGEIKVYDKPAINIVARTADADGVLVIDDPVVPVQINVEEVSTSLLNNAIDAAINAAAEAEKAIEDVRDEETAIQAAEAARVLAEQGRVSAEQSRVAQASADHTLAGQDHTRAESDHGTASDDHTLAVSDHGVASGDHTTALGDHSLAESDHTRAEADHGVAGSDHTIAQGDHTQAGSDHSTAVADHTQAGADHTVAGQDHTQAGTDHNTAASDHTQAGLDHTQAGEDHTQALADHQVMAGYDNRLNAVEGEVDQLEAKVTQKETFSFQSSGWKTLQFPVSAYNHYGITTTQAAITSIRVYRGGTMVESLSFVTEINVESNFVPTQNGDYLEVYLAASSDIIIRNNDSLSERLNNFEAETDDKFEELNEKTNLVVQEGSFSVDSSGWKQIVYSVQAGNNYEITTTNTITSVMVIKNGTTQETISLVVESGTPGVLTTTKDGDVLEIYFVGAASITIKNLSAIIPQLDELGKKVLPKYEIDKPNGGDQYIQRTSIFSTYGQRVYMVVENKSNLRMYYSINMNYSDIGENHYIANQWIFPYEKKIIILDYLKETLIGLRFIRVNNGVYPAYNIKVYDENPFFNIKGYTLPRLGNGSYVISKDIETLCHSPRVFNFDTFFACLYHTSMVRTTEGGTKETGGNYRLELAQIDKINGSIVYRTITDDIHSDEIIDGQKASYFYNPSIGFRLNKSVSPWGRNLVMRFCAIANGQSMMLCKVLNYTSGELSQLIKQTITYNGNTIDWTWNNYIKMVNSLYGHSFDETLTERYTLEASGICEYNGVFYCVVAHQCADESSDTTTNVPYVLMSSNDCIDWTPIAELLSNRTSAECEIAILNGKCLVVFRNQGEGVFYLVCNTNGNIIKNVTKISNVSSKPFALSYEGELYAFYNIETLKEYYGGRNKLGIAKLNQSNELELVQSHSFTSGCEYFTAWVYGSQIIVANNSDIRGLNHISFGTNYGCCNDITLQELVLDF